MSRSKVFGSFQRIGIFEGFSFLLLLGVAMPLKYLAGKPLAVTYIGMAHGILFIAYLYMIHQCRMVYGWSLRTAALGVLAAVLPFGPFVFDSWVKKKMQAAGQL
ncbi:MAG TPA: DUF3817 domain-containing protein [Phnomibacter sp.]|nr:DUF3817 domain-containing protein [Phnomibacter sp.]